jgi:hypothetical protein
LFEDAFHKLTDFVFCSDDSWQASLKACLLATWIQKSFSTADANWLFRENPNKSGGNIFTGARYA